jgi:TRAP transporter TAXI family solute receptor
MKKLFLSASIGLVLAALLAGCGSPATPAPIVTEAPATEAAAPVDVPVEQQICQPGQESLNAVNQFGIGTGGQGGVFYPLGRGLAQILTANMPGLTFTAAETGGSVDNMKMVQTGELQLGFSTVDSAYDAIHGQGAYAAGGPVKACALAVLYTSFVHVIASQASGIDSIAAMQGHVISVGDSGSSTEGAADRILTAAGLDPQTGITRRNLAIADATAALAAGEVDALFWIGGLPTGAVRDMLAAGAPVRFIDASQYSLPLIDEYGPVYQVHTLSKDVYGLPADVDGIGIGNILFVHDDMSEEQAYQILVTIFDHLDEVHALHPQVAGLTVDNAAGGSSIPLHPGAIRFFEDRGVIQ